MNETGLQNLVNAIILQAIRDYKVAIENDDLEMINEIEEYVDGDDYCGELVGIRASYMRYILERIRNGEHIEIEKENKE